MYQGHKFSVIRRKRNILNVSQMNESNACNPPAARTASGRSSIHLIWKLNTINLIIKKITISNKKREAISIGYSLHKHDERVVDDKSSKIQIQTNRELDWKIFSLTSRCKRTRETVAIIGSY